VDRSERHEQRGGEGEDCEFVHDCLPWIFFSSPSSVYSTNERSLSAPCPTFDPGELTPSNCDKQSGTSSSTNTKYVNMLLTRMAKRVFGERWGYFLNVPDDLSLLASGIRACSAVEMPEVSKA
jgi:hypothetical protein